MNNKADIVMFSKLIEFALENSDNPGKLARSLTGQIRELIGGKMVIMFSYDVNRREFRLMDVSPERRKEIALKNDICLLLKESIAFKEVRILNNNDPLPAISSIMKKLKINQSIYVPLIINKQLTGAILIHDIFSDSGMGTIVRTLQDISGILAMTVRNSLSFQVLEELNATKDKFFSIISHDLLSPFNAILGFTDILIGNLKENDTSKTEKYLGFIKTSSEYARELLENLLVWARSQTGEIDFEPGKLDIRELILDNIELIRGAALKKQIRVIHSLNNVKPVHGDDNMINTVLRNLLSNAVKFTRPGGLITVSTREVDNRCEVSVKDNGTGITPGNLDKLFSLGQKYSARGTANEKGTGLGLILCREFVEKQGGKIMVKSEQGKGSDFRFTLLLSDE
jgi:signal transduction histidine kinase